MASIITWAGQQWQYLFEYIKGLKNTSIDGNSIASQPDPARLVIDAALMTQITIIYDTSYLMNGGSVHDPRSKLDISQALDLLNDKELSDVFSNISNSNFHPLRHVIPTEVKVEIVRHLNSEDKAPSARTARARCAQIMALEGYQELSLAGIPIIPNRETLLGPDSETDKGIIGLARQIASNTPGLVYVETNDGGIQAELSLLLSQDKLPVFSEACNAAYFLAIKSRLRRVRPVEPVITPR